jgi:protoporphyrinogen/coproporphyrinogen III oxidase
MSSKASNPEVVIVGAGLAGMTAAYQLRDRDVVVLEARDRVGGRTLSGEHDGYWYNSGAQFVWDSRTLDLCQQLGLEVIDAEGALTAVFVRGRLVVASNPYTLLLKMPLSLGEKVNFALTITRLRRMATAQRGLDPELDAKALSEIFGRVSPMTREILEVATQSGTGVSAEEVSGAIGLGYAIHLFGGDVNNTLKAVRGGTQRITQAIREVIDPERVMLDSVVESVEPRVGGVTIRYRRAGLAEEIRADACIVALTADAVLNVVPDLPARKRAALEQMLPYSTIMSVAWLTDESGPMPWDRLVAVPALGLSFELFNNSAFFSRKSDRDGRRPGGTFVTLAAGPRAEALWALDDQAVRAQQIDDLTQMFPGARDVFRRAETRVERWRGLPRFRRGWLQHQAALRAAHGQIFFCGDYTAQPGTPGAVGSGFHVARALRETLG